MIDDHVVGGVLDVSRRLYGLLDKVGVVLVDSIHNESKLSNSFIRSFSIEVF